MMIRMEESCHRRRKQQQQLQELQQQPEVVPSLLQLPSGEDEDDVYYYHHHHPDDNNDNKKDQQDKQPSQPQPEPTRGRPRRRYESPPRPRPRRRRPKDELPPLPFWKLFLYVGMTLGMICLVGHWMYRRVYPYDPQAGMIEEIVYIVDDDDANPNRHSDNQNNKNNKNQNVPPENPLPHEPSSPEYTEQDEAHLAILAKQQGKQPPQEEVPVLKGVPETAPPIPHFELSTASEWDVFGILTSTTTTTTTISSLVEDQPTSTLFWKVAHGLRQQFSERYGTENAARMLLDKGLTTFASHRETTNEEASIPDKDKETGGSRSRSPPSDIHATACRFHAARKDQRPFYIAFGGYSVTAGRGNHHEQSFPFQLQRILETAVKMVGIPSLKVVNAAIGGSPAFPYGWCMKNFWGPSPDVVSWDYSMNEAGSVPEGLEAYIRHLIATYPENVPKLIVKDTYLATPRRDVVGQYMKWLQDPVVLHTGPAIKPFLERKDAHNPIGFQEWRKFGAPEGSPGQALHHPALKEHELMGWMLAMHFLTALEYLESHNREEMNDKCSGRTASAATTTMTTSLPPPLTAGHNMTDYDGMLFGHPPPTITTSPASPETWKMNPVHCRTTFQPLLSGDLSELVVRGTTAEDLDVSLPKSQMYYNRGWTFDLSDEERQMKRKLSLYENELGFVDSKEAYYGIFESPAMQVLVPYLPLPGGVIDDETPGPVVGQPAADWFESIVVCQVHEKRDDPTACNMGSDVGFVVGGINATSIKTMKDTGTLYLGKPVCTKIAVPPTAPLTSHNTLLAASYANPDARQRLLDMDQVGVLMTVQVTNPHIARVNQACSVSHIVWEQRPPPQEPVVLLRIET